MLSRDVDEMFITSGPGVDQSQSVKVFIKSDVPVFCVNDYYIKCVMMILSCIYCSFAWLVLI